MKIWRKKWKSEEKSKNLKKKWKSEEKNEYLKKKWKSEEKSENLKKKVRIWRKNENLKKKCFGFFFSQWDWTDPFLDQEFQFWIQTLPAQVYFGVTEVRDMGG